MGNGVAPGETGHCADGTGAVSRRDALKLGGTLLAGAALPRWQSRLPSPTVMVGEPGNPAALAAAIVEAYSKGARDITIAPGTYVLPATGTNGIELKGWTQAVLRCKEVTIIFKETAHRPILLSGCSHVAMEDAVLQFSTISYTQGRVTAIAEDDKGRYVEWRIDTGYAADIDPVRATFNVIDHTTRLLRVGTGDSHAQHAVTVSPGVFRLYQIGGMIEGAVLEDWLVCRAKGGSSIVQLDQSKDCAMRRITLKNAGFAAFFETGGDGGHEYVDCRVARGPKPPGAMEEQLVACGADGFHSNGTKVGPTIRRCVWEGVLLDDCIAIHGSFETVIRGKGNKLILDKGNRAGFVVGEPVRISSSDGFFTQAACVALRKLDEADGQLELTLDHPISVPAGSRAGNPGRCGRSYRIIDCSLGNTRSRGILVKADDGLIQGCTIEGCGMSAISIGPEYFWNEADYCWNVTVEGNKLRHNALRNSVRADGVIFIHGDGAMGNRNIRILSNVFDENYSPFMMNIGWIDGVRIANNSVNAPSPLPLSEPGAIVRLHNTRNATLAGNTYQNPGPSVTRAIDTGEAVVGLAGNDASGIRITGR